MARYQYSESALKINCQEGKECSSLDIDGLLPEGARLASLGCFEVRGL